MNIVLIGLGMVARTHVDAIAATKGILNLVGVYGRNIKRAATFAEDVSESIGGTPRVYDSIEAIAQDPTIDFVIVATPPNARLEICEILTASGKPVLMEKPIERDTQAATHIVELFEAAQLPLGIVFQHRARESSQKLSQLLQSGCLGDVAVVEIKIPWWREQAYYDEPGRGTYARDGGGVLISQAIHTLDLALSVLGPVATVQAMACSTSLHSMEAEDYVNAGLMFESGAVGSLVASTASFPGGAESIVLHCEKASVTLQSGTIVTHWRDGRTESFGESADTGGGADPMAFTHAWHQGVIEDFADAIKNSRAPMASGRDALNVHRLIDALVTSSKQQSAITLSHH